MKTARLLIGCLLPMLIACLPARAFGKVPAEPKTNAKPVLVEVDAQSLPGVFLEHRGHPLLVNVWSTWCAPCLEEMPMLIDIAQRYASPGLTLMLISADLPLQRASVLRFLSRNNAPGPSYLRTGPEGPFIKAFHPDWSGSLPATLLINAQGKVEQFWGQVVPPHALEQSLNKLLPASSR